MSVIRWAKRRGAGARHPASEAGGGWPTARTAWALLTKKEPGAGGRAGCRLKGFPGSALALDVGGKDGGRVRANGRG